MISTDSVVTTVRDQLTSGLGGDAVVLDLQSGKYFGFEAVGARIWELIQQPRKVSDIRDALLHEYDADPAECQRDLLAFLQEMQEAGLIEVKDA
jgi:hypothetical protein